MAGAFFYISKLNLSFRFSSGNIEKATDYFCQLIDVANSPDANKPELEKAVLFLKANKTPNKLD